MTETQRLQQSVSRWRGLTIVIATVQLSGWMFVLGCGSGSEDSGVINTEQLSAAQDDAKDEIVCKNLKIVDDDGKELASLGPRYSGDKSATLSLYDEYKGNHVNLNTLTGLTIQYGKGWGSLTVNALNFRVNPSERSSLIDLIRLEGEREIRQLTEREEQKIKQLQKKYDQGRRVSLTNGIDYGGNLSIYNKDGILSTKITQGEIAGGMLNIYNPLGKPVVEVQSNKTNQGAISLNNVNGEYSKGLFAD